MRSGGYIEQTEVSLKAALQCREDGADNAADDHYRRAAVWSNLAIAAAIKEAAS